MLKLLFCLLILFSHNTYSKCDDEFLYKKEVFEFNKKKLKSRYVFFKEYKKICQKKSKMCSDMLSNYKEKTAKLSSDFFNSKLIKECSQHFVEKKKQFNENYEDVGLYLNNKPCFNSQMANQACWNFDKDLKSCQVKSVNGKPHLFVQCQETKNYNKLCYSNDQVMEKLSNPYDVCKITNENWSKYKDCIKEDIKNFKIKNCPVGCVGMPSFDVCLWKKIDIGRFLGCAELISMDHFHAYCSKRCKNKQFWDKQKLTCIGNK